MNEFYSSEKKDALPDNWQQWADQSGDLQHLDEHTKAQYFGVNIGSDHSEPRDEVAQVDVPMGDLREGMA
jgi:hypothetical protein